MPASVTCPFDLPYLIAAGALVTCQYQASLADTSDHIVTAIVSTDSGPDSVIQRLISFAWGYKSRLVDECVDVSDDRYGSLGMLCADEGAKTFVYPFDIGPYEGCGQFSFDNTATYHALDTGETGSSTWVVNTTIPCDAGCSLTPGYWKTHSEYGPAPYDSTWASLPDGADTLFYLSGQSYYDVLWTAPHGNAYYILAHAFIAARLNQLDGADTTSIDGALAAAIALFEVYTPANLAIGRGGAFQALKAQFIDLGAILDSYNNGLIGPGHCDE